MHIFIDESGTFSAVAGRHSPSLIGALVIPDTNIDRAFARYERLRLNFPRDGGEVKGRLLNESQIAKVIDLLIKNNALFETTAVDMGMHSAEEIIHHKKIQEEKFTSNLTNEHCSTLQAEVWRLRRRLECMPLQLYVQSVAMFETISETLKNATLYFCQRTPSELGHFHWVLDGKDKNRTDWEDWWSFVVMPALEARFARSPFEQFVDGDYSYFARFNTVVSAYKAEKLGFKDRRNATSIKNAPH